MPVDLKQNDASIPEHRPELQSRIVIAIDSGLFQVHSSAK
jgi:hypothetical protein